MVKVETRSYYEQAVEAAVHRVTAQLDEALDLESLAKLAALSVFHFHRIFRGICGETPLEMHRRLRMERAAWRLLFTESPITTIAFDAGYETHESFTRAFRRCYSEPPMSFRKRAVAPPQFRLAARNGVHFDGDHVAIRVPNLKRENTVMDVKTVQLSKLRVATVAHRGPYNQISEAFARLGQIAGVGGLFEDPAAAMVALYYDDVESTPTEQLRSDAGIVVSENTVIPTELAEAELRAGLYGCYTHVGPYTELGDVWSRLMGLWLPQSGYRVGEGVGFEKYLNMPGQVSPDKLVTELYLPLADTAYSSS